ncbi:MAG: class 1 fructose-bisphosphatase [Nitrospinota bacterium]|nr:class 1 fructose-bisphosphatase [Nitrospinota bacterium]
MAHEFRKLGTTVTRLIMDEQRKHPTASGDFSSMLMELIVAMKLISYEVNKAGLLNVLGAAGTNNIQDEEQQKLDVFANNTIFRAMDHTGYLCGMASEENADILEIPKQYPKGKYALVYDPLDGSSNIDANVSIGTIFGIYKKISDGTDYDTEDFLQPGHKMVAGGYTIYGSSTMLVITTGNGNGVHGFTLDPNVGEFILSHPNIKTPQKGKIYSVNEGNTPYWDEKTKDVINYFKDKDKKTGRPYSSRYIGSLVSDFHRNLLYGGIFMYPIDFKEPSKSTGKLRLLYEANPLAFVAENAGGLATDGKNRILDMKPTDLHQRVPLYIGSKEDVETAMKILNG